MCLWTCIGDFELRGVVEHTANKRRIKTHEACAGMTSSPLRSPPRHGKENHRFVNRVPAVPAVNCCLCRYSQDVSRVLAMRLNRSDFRKRLLVKGGTHNDV
eukprot:GHVU01173887.1.p1 GENE.GHVU01173887.1~~GHVU01173887.1.p1  ORF type:complete len:101 (-),score=2.41 GHVU01173887.1:151-453(-)